MSDRFEQLLRTLNQSELEMTSYELADLCWLLLHSPQIVEPTESKKAVEDTSPHRNADSSLSEFKQQDRGNEKEKKKEPAGQLFPRQQSQDSFVGGSSSLTFPVDNPSDIGSSLSLARALKALLRRVPTQDRPSILDEVRTVENFAATDRQILAPVFKAALEPWLELALVIDRSSSMDIWHQTLADLKTVLQHYGIFRDVQVWQLALKENNLVLYKGLNKTNSRVSHPKELLNPNGRRIILVVSDCVASYWQDGKMFPLLELWSQSSPLAILQMLPEWLWLKTGLGLGAKVTLVSDEPGLTNSRLKIRDVLLWENVFHDKNRLQIPVFTLEPLSVERWSGVVVGRSDTKVAGFVLTPDTKEELDTTAELNLTPEEIVRRFRNNASPLAQELAELLAAAPTIFLPVVRLLRKEMLPEAGQVQIAEVFLGGILRVRSSEINETDPDTVLYDFINPEVRKILQRSSTRSTTLDVFDRVSKYIAKQLNLSLRDFLAKLKKPLSEVDQEKQGIIRPFAEVAASILRNLGGNYLAIAQQLEKGAAATPQFPQLKTILLVEDNPKTASQTQFLLSHQGRFTVIISENFEQIMNYARSGDIDLILLNYRLNHTYYQKQSLTGVDIARMIRSDTSISSNLVLIGFSATADKEPEFRAYCDGFYPKPVVDAKSFITYLTTTFNLKVSKTHKPGKHYAIAIGINQYRNLPTVQYSVKDASVMQQWFDQKGFEQVHQFSNNISTLVEIPIASLTQEGREYLRQANLFHPLSAEDTLWFFFSGHGIHRSGRDYLLLADSDSEFLETTALPLVELVRRLQSSGAGKVILLLDCDRNPSQSQVSSGDFTRDEVSSLEQQLTAQLSSEQELIIFYASSPKQGAYEIENLQHGTFTYALREALEATQGNLSLERLEQFLSQRVSELNEQYNRPTQTPQSLILPTPLQKWIPFPSSLQVFEFKTPTVNRHGEIIKQDTKLAQYFTEDLGNAVTLDMVAIRGGTFMMGSPEGEGYDREKPQHKVTVPPFFMGKYPVTQAQWRAVATLPQVNRKLKPNPSHFKGDDLPVESISWYDAVEFCDRLSKLTGQKYRLPSEAEWEYACRGGTTTPFHFGETITPKLANYNGEYTYGSGSKEEYRQKTTPVGSFKVANAFGLYDMHGNIWEWCADHWHGNYKGAPKDGSVWTEDKENDNQFRLLRGGSWCYFPSLCRSACRDYGNPDYDDFNIGFRVVVSGART